MRSSSSEADQAPCLRKGWYALRTYRYTATKGRFGTADTGAYELDDDHSAFSERTDVDPEPIVAAVILIDYFL